MAVLVKPSTVFAVLAVFFPVIRCVTSQAGCTPYGTITEAFDTTIAIALLAVVEASGYATLPIKVNFLGMLLSIRVLFMTTVGTVRNPSHEPTTIGVGAKVDTLTEPVMQSRPKQRSFYIYH
tara:strand:- start:7534 stop:7899 length:366 start_codon:yes stop_codon:yes gene_type:complete